MTTENIDSMNFVNPRSSLSEAELIRNVVAKPRTIPRNIREELAILLFKDLVKGESIEIRDSQKFIERYGIFYPLLIHLRHSDIWKSLKELAADSPEIAAPITDLFITKIFDIIDQFPKIRESMYNDLDKEMLGLLARFERILEKTNEQWTRDIRESYPVWNDEIIKILTEISDMIDQICQNQDISSEFIENTCKNLLESLIPIQKFTDTLKNTESGISSDEINPLLNTLKTTADELESDYRMAIGDRSQDTVVVDGDISKRSFDDSDSTDTGNQNSDNDQIQKDEKTGETHKSMEENESVQEENITQIEGTGSGDKDQETTNPATLNNMIQQIIKKIQGNIQRQSGSPGHLQSGTIKDISDFTNTANSGTLLQTILQKAVIDPVNMMLQSLKPHLETLKLLNQLFPGKDWMLETTNLKKDYIKNLEKYAKLIEKNEELKEILRLIGRIELEYGIKKQSISPMGRSEVHSITLSNDISRLLPIEAVKFHHPLLRKKLLADFTEGKLLTYHLRGKNWVAGPPKKREQGPVVALVDTSGSMHGDPEVVAKSVILALAKKMLKQERDVKVILFSGPKNTEEIELTSRKKMGSEFLKFLQGSFGGGTDFNTALKSGLESLKQPVFKGADLLFITDGESAITNQAAIDEWNKIKEDQEARIFSLIINNHTAGGLSSISDYTYFIQKDRTWSLQNSPAKMIRFIASSTNPKSQRNNLNPPAATAEIHQSKPDELQNNGTIIW